MERGELIARGRTGEVFALGQGEILKLYVPGFPAPAVDREYTISRLVYQNGMSTPYAKEKVEIDSRPGIVFERVTGPTMLHLMAAEPTTVPAMARRLAELHHQVHQIKVSGLSSRKGILSREIQSVSLLDDRDKKSILSCLEALPEECSLCHGDFHPDNVLVSDGVPTIIDWMTGASGSPASDVVRSCLTFITATPPPGASSAIVEGIHSLKNTFYTQYLSRYLALSRILMDELEQWLLPVAAARLTEGLPAVEKNQLLAMVRTKLDGGNVLPAI